MSDVKLKYKPCCNRRCCLGLCQTRSQGGCYCVCRLKDYEENCHDLLKGRAVRSNGVITFDPNGMPIPLGGFERDNVMKDLEEIQKRLKTYKIDDD